MYTGYDKRQDAVTGVRKTMTTTSQDSAQERSGLQEPSGIWPVLLITSLFFFWGMANALNDILIPQFQKAFDLTDMQSALVQSAFYAGYFLLALPAGYLMRRFGYKASLVTGLLLFALGAFLFYPAANLQQYFPFLAALFIIASGLAFLETSANPLMTVLGDPKNAAFRLNLAQAFNPLGCLAGIWIGQEFILSGVQAAQAKLDTTSPNALHDFYVREAQAVQIPYLVIGCVILGWALLVALCKFPKAASLSTANHDEASLSTGQAIGQLFKHKRFVLGVVAQFFYVGAQVGIWSYTIKYAQSEAALSDKMAAVYLIYHYVAFAIGRFSGSFLMKILSPIRIFTLFALVNVGLAGLSATMGGINGLYCLVGMSLFMSIMFPTIFALSLKDLGPLTKTGSSLLVMSIIGGAILTPIMGYISDSSHIRTAMYVPAVCFVILVIYGLTAQKDGAKPDMRISH
jgi:MFS transporter, FHS family, L-fucose permease